jgi:hypothetical protein
MRVFVGLAILLSSLPLFGAEARMSAEVWRDFQPRLGGEAVGKEVMAAVDVPTGDVPVRVELTEKETGRVVVMRLKYSYAVDRKTDRYHATGGGPTWEVGAKVGVRVRLADGHWFVLPDVKVTATH